MVSLYWKQIAHRESLGPICETSDASEIVFKLLLLLSLYYTISPNAAV